MPDDSELMNEGVNLERSKPFALSPLQGGACSSREEFCNYRHAGAGGGRLRSWLHQQLLMGFLQGGWFCLVKQVKGPPHGAGDVRDEDGDAGVVLIGRQPALRRSCCREIAPDFPTGNGERVDVVVPDRMGSSLLCPCCISRLGDGGDEVEIPEELLEEQSYT